MKLWRLYCQQYSQIYKTIREANVRFAKEVSVLKASSNNESDENNDKKVQETEQLHEDFWNTVPGKIFQKYLEEACNQIVY